MKNFLSIPAFHHYLLKKHFIEHLQNTGTVSHAGDTTVNKIEKVPTDMHACARSCVCGCLRE